MQKKKTWANFQRINELLPQKLSLSSQTYGFGIRDPRSGIRDLGSEIRDPRTGIRDPEKTHSGSRGQKGTGSAKLAKTKCDTCILIKNLSSTEKKNPKNPPVII
jgi:hypothetical protein